MDSSAARRTILLVEDEPSVRRLMRAILERAGYRLLVAGDGVEALEIASRFEGHIHLLVSDVVMPRMRGGTLAHRLTTERPGTKVLFVTGYPEDENRTPELIGSSLRKPFTDREILRKVRELLDSEGGLLSAMADRRKR